MYVTVSNKTKRAATVHMGTCMDLGDDPLMSFASSDRRAFDSELEALAFAREDRPRNYGFCRHCLSGMRWVG